MTNKPRRSKYQLVFEPLSIAEQVAIRYDEHIKKYGTAPRKIYLNEKQYNLYRDTVPEIIKALNWEENVLYFKGAKIYEV